MYRLHNTPTEVARTLLVVVRRGSLSAAEEITGHKHETIGWWLCAAAQHAEQITEVLVRDLHLTGVARSFAWLLGCRRLSCCYDGLCAVEACWIEWACVRWFVSRMAQEKK